MPTTEYTVAGRNIYLSDKRDKQVPLEELPVDMYVLNTHPSLGFFLTKSDTFKVPEKIYGSVKSHVTRFLNTFKDRQSTTGILLTGVKGSGKTLEMMLTALEAISQGYPVIMVNQAYSGPAFNKFVKSIQQPCVFIFDEFEKVYDDQGQQELLTLLDGTYSSQKLFIFTCNDKYKINTHMLNRPGRIFYTLKYSGIETEFIVEYCQDKLNDKTKIDSIVRAASLVEDFNFDMLKAIVEELNRYPEDSVRNVIDILNIEMGYSSRTFYDVQYFKNDELIDVESEQSLAEAYPNQLTNPLMETNLVASICLDYTKKGAKAEKVVFPLSGDNVKVSRDLGTIESVNGKWKVVITKPKPKVVDYSRFYD